MTNWSIKGNAAKMQTRFQFKSARVRVLSALSAALLVIGPGAPSANAEDITIAQLRGQVAGSSALVEQRVWPYERAAQLYVRH